MFPCQKKELMKILAIVLVTITIHSFHAYSQERQNDLRIDCGALNKTPISEYSYVYWLPDGNYINTGQNHILTYTNNFSTLNTHRYFRDANKSCYNLLFYASDGKFLFRAGFYYGNYDGLSKPPSFNLEVDGNLWATVTTSMSEDEAIYHEMIYSISGDSSQVCLVRTSDDIPFISSLEAKILRSDDRYKLYRLMENKTALMLHSRINYGANKTIGKLANYDEIHNRVWEPKEMSEYLNVVSKTITRGIVYGENEPPRPALDTAIQAKNLSDSIILPVDYLPETAVAYFVLYFRNPEPGDYPFGKFEIFLDSQKLGVMDLLRYWNSTNFLVSFYPVQVNGAANLTISATNDSEVAPLLNAMEVFSVVNMTYVSSMAGYLPNSSVALWFMMLAVIAFAISL